MRAELTELDRGEHLARRKHIYIARPPETRAAAAQAAGMNRSIGNVSENSSPENSSPTFAADAASKLGIADRTVHISVRHAERICGKASELIRSTEAEDSGVEL